MRILSVVTLVTPIGEYGGPVRVALNQARALIDAGHDVTVAGGTRGFGGDLPTRIDGVPVRLFRVGSVLPGTGFAGLASPGLQRWLGRAVRDVDVVHVHLARDLVTLPAAARARRAGARYIVQTHGMIDPSDNILAGPLDRLLTVPVLQSAHAVLYLTERERRDLQSVGGTSLRLREVRNGVPRPTVLRPPGTPREVLYLARLASRKRPVLFASMAQRLAAEFADTVFTIVGPDEGEGDAIDARLMADSAGGRITRTGPLRPDRTEERLASASIYVLPAVDEPYPMSVLEAMANGRPVVVTDSCGLASAIEESGSGIVTGPDEDAIVDAVRRLLADPDLSAAMGAAGAVAARERFGMGPVTAALEHLYRG